MISTPFRLKSVKYRLFLFPVRKSSKDFHTQKVITFILRLGRQILVFYRDLYVRNEQHLQP